jgi:hypothetical protein
MLQKLVKYGVPLTFFPSFFASHQMFLQLMTLRDRIRYSIARGRTCTETEVQACNRILASTNTFLEFSIENIPKEKFK